MLWKRQSGGIVRFSDSSSYYLNKHMYKRYIFQSTGFSYRRIMSGNTLEGDVSDVIALDQLTSPFSPRKATRMSP